MSAEAIARLRAFRRDDPEMTTVRVLDLRALLDAHAALETSNATLRLLVAGLTIAVDMEPSEDPLEEPWVRLVEAAHKHGRKLEREALETAHTEALDALDDLVGLAGSAMAQANNDGAEYDAKAELEDALAVLAKAGRR